MATTLQSITGTILDESSPTHRLREALDDFSLLCAQVGGIQAEASFSAEAEDALLGQGVAINPRAAAHCISDYTRTVVFIRGVYAALNNILQSSAGRPISILYAGCGPYATLLLPLLARFDLTVLDITLLDIHAQSLRSVRQLLDYFGLDTTSIGFVQADASSYQHPTALHLIIAETMQKALEQEPQLAVTANLAPQLYPHGVFIPQEIRVNLFFTSESLGSDDPRQLIDLANLITLSTSSIGQIMSTREAAGEGGCYQVLATELAIPSALDTANGALVMHTHVTVYGSYILGDFDAEITLPSRVHDIPTPGPGDCFQVAYRLGTYPRFAFY